jgi:DNA-binding SARP family transcriptional activator
MADFLQSCACAGGMPRQLAGSTYFYRNALLARMMRDRSRVRYLLAPTGFGKSMLACSYAQLLRGFEGVFWVNAQSPCFLRDLDADSITSGLLEISHEGDMVVFDDLPRLDARRRDAVWGLCCALIADGREVVACSTPNADPLDSHRDACLMLDPVDFLYDAEDFENLRSFDAKARHVPPPTCPADAVPCLALRAARSCERFLVDQIDDADDALESGLTFVLVVLERGSFDDVEELAGCAIDASRLSSDRLRPFVRVDEFRREFSIPGFSMKSIIRAFMPHAKRIAEAFGKANASTLAAALADRLLKCGAFDRAAQLIIALCEPLPRAHWLMRNQDAMLDRCAVASAEAVHESLQGARIEGRQDLLLASAVRRCLLGASDSAAESLSRMARRADRPLPLRVNAATVAFLFDDGGRSEHSLRAAFSAIPTGPRILEGGISPASVNPLLAFWTCGRDEPVPVLKAAAAAEPSAAVLTMACCLRAGFPADAGLRVPLRDSVVDALKRCASMPRPCAAETVLHREMMAPAARCLEIPPPILRALAVRCESYESSLEVQSAAYLRARESSGTNPSRNGSGPIVARAQVLSMGAIPPLRVRLFGRFEVGIGDSPVDSPGFRRQKVRLLLALLVLESGREISCNRLADLLWPESDSEKARHNLYSSLSLLRKGLMLPMGGCPYLKRPQGTVRLEPGFVQSDVADLADFCRRLRFEQPNPDSFQRMLEQVREIYRGELLPGEASGTVIEASRAECLNRLVESLLCAAGKLAAMGERRIGLLFAQQALSYDPRREDCYEMLMKLQAGCGQRPAAIGTWLNYCRFITEEMGLDPSPHIAGLYGRIISDEDLVAGF